MSKRDVAIESLRRFCAGDVAGYYDYEKGSGTITIAQLFRFQDGKISEMLLVFDARGPIR